MTLSRRRLLSGLSAGAGFALAPGLNVSFAAEGTPARDILIVLFQRGACDWLQMLAPAGDPNYIAARPNIRVQTSGESAGIGLGSLDGVDLYLSASAPELKPLYDSGDLAFVHATGLYTADRSHFSCQANMERGTADADAAQNTGWLARHVAASGVGGELAVVSQGSANPMSLLGEPSAIAIADPQNFNVSGGNINAGVIRFLNKGGTTAYAETALKTLDTVANIQAALQDFQDTSGSAGYTNGALSQSLRAVGRLIRMNVGLDVVTVDYGSWDHHNNLVAEFNTRTVEFARAIAAFWRDMEPFRHRITFVTMTEFGRRFRENTNRGTDHGSASGMMVLGGAVNGGKIYGAWPGLGASQLNNGDLAITTDYRQVLAEILVKRHGETKLSSVFPSVTYAPLGILNT